MNKFLVLTGVTTLTTLGVILKKQKETEKRIQDSLIRINEQIDAKLNESIEKDKAHSVEVIDAICKSLQRKFDRIMDREELDELVNTTLWKLYDDSKKFFSENNTKHNIQGKKK